MVHHLRSITSSAWTSLGGNQERPQLNGATSMAFPPPVGCSRSVLQALPKPLASARATSVSTLCQCRASPGLAPRSQAIPRYLPSLGRVGADVVVVAVASWKWSPASSAPGAVGKRWENRLRGCVCPPGLGQSPPAVAWGGQGRMQGCVGWDVQPLRVQVSAQTETRGGTHTPAITGHRGT